MTFSSVDVYYIKDRGEEIDIDCTPANGRERGRDRMKVYSQERQRMSSLKWSMVGEQTGRSSQGLIYAYV